MLRKGLPLRMYPYKMQVEFILVKDYQLSLSTEYDKVEKKRVTFDDKDSNTLFKLIKGKPPYRDWRPTNKDLRSIKRLWVNTQNKPK